MADIVSQNAFDVMGDYLGAMLEYDELASLQHLGEVPMIVVAESPTGSRRSRRTGESPAGSRERS